MTKGHHDEATQAWLEILQDKVNKVNSAGGSVDAGVVNLILETYPELVTDHTLMVMRRLAEGGGCG